MSVRPALVLTLALLFALPVEAVDPGLRSAVNAKVAEARRIAPELGVDVVDLAAGESIYTFNAEVPRIVASNMKLVTSAAALEYLGPGYFFETSVFLRGELRDGVLEGDLAVLGGGDPSLSGRQYFGDSYGPFREWARELLGLGVRRIAGEAYLVHGLFQGESVHPDWPKDQLTRWYEAPVEALSFNDNCVLVKVRPGPRSGAPVVVEVVPPLEIFRVESSATTIADRRRQNIEIDRREGTNVLTVTGRIDRRTEIVDKWVAVEDPLEYFGAALEAAFAEEGLIFASSPRPVEHPPAGEWKRALTHRSDLLTALEVINKRSQNFYAESVLKLLGARHCERGTWAAGTKLLEEYLLGIGVERDGFRIADGSGMSRRNRMTPSQLTHLLVHMYRHERATEFLRTLPWSGEPGLRWEKRLEDPPYRGNVMAKTGTLNGVSTLSGYAKARSGKLYAFSILMNATRSNWRARDAQDAILRALIDHG